MITHILGKILDFELTPDGTEVYILEDGNCLTRIKLVPAPQARQPLRQRTNMRQNGTSLQSLNGKNSNSNNKNTDSGYFFDKSSHQVRREQESTENHYSSMAGSYETPKRLRRVSSHLEGWSCALKEAKGARVGQKREEIPYSEYLESDSYSNSKTLRKNSEGFAHSNGSKSDENDTQEHCTDLFGVRASRRPRGSDLSEKEPKSGRKDEKSEKRAELSRKGSSDLHLDQEFTKNQQFGLRSPRNLKNLNKSGYKSLESSE